MANIKWSSNASAFTDVYTVTLISVRELIIILYYLIVHVLSTLPMLAFVYIAYSCCKQSFLSACLYSFLIVHMHMRYRHRGI